MGNHLKVVGLDPSFRHWGVALGYISKDTGQLTIDQLHTITTQPYTKSKLSKSSWDISQAAILYEEVNRLVDGADIICIEVPYGSQDAKSALGRGICLAILSTLKAKHTVYVTPQASKKILGDSKATKADSVRWASERHPEAPWKLHNKKLSVEANNHCSDAVVAIYAAAEQVDFSKFI